MKCHSETASEEKKKNPETGSQLLGWPADLYCLPGASVHSRRIVSLALLPLLLLCVPIRRRASPPPQNRLWSKQVPEKGLSSPS